MYKTSVCLDRIILRIGTLVGMRQKKNDKKRNVVLFITKFPPVIGGVATLEYWRAQALAKLGNTVLVVTNCMEDINGYARSVLLNNDFCFSDISKVEGKVKVFYASKACMWNGQIKRNHQHIPYNDTSTSKLYSIAKMVIEKYNPDVIYSGYLEPYGLVSYLLADKYNKPYIVGFAGSDFNRLLTIPELNNIYCSVFKNATLIITTWNKAERLINMGVKPSKITYTPQPIIFPSKYYFNANQNRGFSVGIYGKCGSHKKVEVILKSIGDIKEVLINCMTIPANETYLRCSVKKYCPNNKITFYEAVAPNNMVKFLNRNQIMFFFDENFDVTEHVPIAPIEAGLCGVCVVFSKTLYKKMMEFGFKDNFNCIVLNECSTNYITKFLSQFINDQKKYIEIGYNAAISLKENVNKYVSEYQNTLNTFIQESDNNNFIDEILMLYIYFKYSKYSLSTI